MRSGEICNFGLDEKRKMATERSWAKQIARELRYDRVFPNYARDIDSCETVGEISELMASMRRKI